MSVVIEREFFIDELCERLVLRNYSLNSQFVNITDIYASVFCTLDNAD